MVGDIRNGQEELKDRLPYVCPHYGRFKDNHRAQANIIPEAFTFMTCVDVDDKELVEPAIERTKELIADEDSDWQELIFLRERKRIAPEKCSLAVHAAKSDIYGEVSHLPIPLRRFICPIDTKRPIEVHP